MRIATVVSSSIILAAAALSGACTEPPAAAELPGQATITFPLVQQSGGNFYRLDAFFQVNSPDGQFHFVGGFGDDPDATVSVAAGLNRIEIQDFWTLSRSTDGGITFSPVPAVLISPNPMNFLLVPNQSTTVQFEFILRDPNADLHLTFGVQETSRQASLLLFVEQGDNGFQFYNDTLLQANVYFNAVPSRTIESDGTHALVFRPLGSALEFSVDPFGSLSQIARTFRGGSVEITVRDHPDGTQDATFTDHGLNDFVPQLTLGAGPALGVDLDDQGFPKDQEITASGMPFTLSSQGMQILSGTVDSFTVHPVRGALPGVTAQE
jgi:hypothetical protein